MEQIKFMEQGTVNRRMTTRARHMEAVARERHYWQLVAILALVAGAMIGAAVTLFVQGVI